MGEDKIITKSISREKQPNALRIGWQRGSHESITTIHGPLFDRWPVPRQVGRGLPLLLDELLALRNLEDSRLGHRLTCPFCEEDQAQLKMQNGGRIVFACTWCHTQAVDVEGEVVKKNENR